MGIWAIRLYFRDSLVFLFLSGTFLAGCSSAGASISATPDKLRPFLTPSPESLVASPIFTNTPAPLPTPTPFTYTIEAGDNLIGIANRFGVNLDDIMLANPGLIASALSPGQQIKIPSTPVSAKLATPTPAPVSFSDPDCYPSLDGGLWCFLAVENPFPDTLENLATQISLIGSDGSILASQTALSPLNILPPGRSIALSTFFPPPLPDSSFKPKAQLVTSIRLPSGDERYLPVVAQNDSVMVAWDGASAEVRGQVMPVSGADSIEIPAGGVWVAAVAYDAAGNVVGVRRWESLVSLPAGGRIPFEMQVSSSGGSISRVDLVAEARRPVVTSTP
jgi:LysM repeat protein